jgi:hypothetical protein
MYMAAIMSGFKYGGQVVVGTEVPEMCSSNKKA